MEHFDARTEFGSKRHAQMRAIPADGYRFGGGVCNLAITVPPEHLHRDADRNAAGAATLKHCASAGHASFLRGSRDPQKNSSHGSSSRSMVLRGAPRGSGVIQMAK